MICFILLINLFGNVVVFGLKLGFSFFSVVLVNVIVSVVFFFWKFVLGLIFMFWSF